MHILFRYGGSTLTGEVVLSGVNVNGETYHNVWCDGMALFGVLASSVIREVNVV